MVSLISQTLAGISLNCGFLPLYGSAPAIYKILLVVKITIRTQGVRFRSIPFIRTLHSAAFYPQGINYYTLFYNLCEQFGQRPPRYRHHDLQ